MTKSDSRKGINDTGGHASEGRRDFLKSGVLAGVALCTAPLVGHAASSEHKPAQAATAMGGTRATIEQRRTLGSGPHAMEVTAMGFGAMNVVHAYGPPVPRETALKVIRHAYERGVNFFDTAEVYGPYTSEELLGEALRPVRNEVLYATKFGTDVSEKGRHPGVNSHPDHIKRVCDASLRRLQTDHIDLFYQHRVDPTIPIEDVAGAVKDLIQAGKVRHFGLSAAGAATIRRAHAVQPLTAVQNHYAFWSRTPEDEVLAVCEELGIGFVPWSPLGMGYLTGTVSAETTFMEEGELRPLFPRFTVEARRANWPVVDLLFRVGRPKGATPGQVALAWLLARKPFIVPIPGTTKVAHLDENLGALNVDLDAQDMRTLDEGFARIRVQGEYTAASELARLDIGDRPGTRSEGGHGMSPLPGASR